MPNVRTAAKNFNWDDLKARDVLFYGGIPSLVYEARLDSVEYVGHLPSQKRNEAIVECIKIGVNDNNVKVLLRSFISGEYLSVLPPLQNLMNTVADEKILWIPYHMVEVLKVFCTTGNVSRDLRLMVQKIVNLFNTFKDAKDVSGDGWEALFVIVLLIRCITGQFDDKLLPLNDMDFSDCDVSYNMYLNLEKLNFGDICNVDELLKQMKKPVLID